LKINRRFYIFDIIHFKNPITEKTRERTEKIIVGTQHRLTAICWEGDEKRSKTRKNKSIREKRSEKKYAP
jgi:hypothetical protein